MALHWNIADTEYQRQPEAQQKKEWPIVNLIILLTMPLGMGAITEKNVTEFITRIRLMEKLNGGYMHKDGGEDEPVPEEMIRKLIGLRTNVTPIRWQTFATRIVNSWRGDLTRQLGREMAQRASAKAAALHSPAPATA